MTVEEKAKAYDEALERAKRMLNSKRSVLVGKEAVESLFPELTESEDERIRKDIIAFLQSMNSHCDPTQDWDLRNRWLPYLEKQKENVEKEYVFRPLAGTDITDAAKQAIRRANEGDYLVLAFNGAYIPVKKGCNASEIVDIYDAYLEKQKTSEEAIRYVKENHSPDEVSDFQAAMNIAVAKAYDKGVQDTLEKQKEPNIEHIQRSWYMEGYIDGKFKKEPRWIIKTDDGGPRYEDNPRHELPLTEDKKEQKPAEWSEEDERMLHGAITIIERNSICNQNMIDWLKSLRPLPHWKPSEEQIDCLAMTLTSKAMDDNVRDVLSKLYDNLKKLMEDEQ